MIMIKQSSARLTAPTLARSETPSRSTQRDQYAFQTAEAGSKEIFSHVSKMSPPEMVDSSVPVLLH